MWLILLVVLSLILVLLPQTPLARIGARSDGRIAPVAENQMQAYRDSYGGQGDSLPFVTRVVKWGQQLFQRWLTYFRHE